MRNMAEHKIGKYIKESLNISDLELDQDNFRIGHQNSQPEIIKTMLSRGGTKGDTKLIGLATSIVTNGFLDLELPCVFPSDNKGKYIVAEGNRRITAMKILHTPELAHGTRLYSEFKGLHAKKDKLTSEVLCAVFDNRKDCLAYILMRHGYGAEGASLIKWNAISKLRADEYVNGTNYQELRIIELVLQKGSLNPADIQKLNDDDFNITNLRRILDDTNVKKSLGIIDNNCIRSNYGENWLVPIWQKIIEVIIEGIHRGEKFTVDKNINTLDQRKKFIDEIITDVYGDAEKPENEVGIIKPEQAKKNQTNFYANDPELTKSFEPSAAPVSPKPSVAKRNPKHSPTQNRKGLIHKSFSPQVLKPPKVINIVAELKRLPVSDYVICSGVMFRIFFELSIAHYMTVNTITNRKPRKDKPDVYVELTLKEKTQAVINHLESITGSDDKALKALKDMLNNSHPISAETLNQYVHSPTYTPDSNTLKAEWDRIQHIFEMLWEK